MKTIANLSPTALARVSFVRAECAECASDAVFALKVSAERMAGDFSALWNRKVYENHLVAAERHTRTYGNIC